MEPHYIKNNRKYPGRLRICKNCKKEEIIRKTNKAEYCKNCFQRHKKSCVKDDEIFTHHGKARHRGKFLKCSNCGIERFVRKDAKYKSDLCKSCSSREKYKKIGKITGKLRFKNGIGVFRKRALSIFPTKCYICLENEINKIDIHHIDLNRENNDIMNLLPLCKSCHKLIHSNLKKGYSHEESIKRIKTKK